MKKSFPFVDYYRMNYSTFWGSLINIVTSTVKIFSWFAKFLFLLFLNNHDDSRVYVVQIVQM